MNGLRMFSYIVLALLTVPVAVILYEGFGPMITPSGYGYALLRSIELTLFGSALAVVISVVLYTPLAYYFARNSTKIPQTISDIPAAIPHPIIGIALLILTSPRNALGQFLDAHGFSLFDTLLGYVVTLVIVCAPIYIKAIQPFFESMNKSHEQFAAGLGATQFRTFVSVVLPNSKRGILSASLIALSRGISEYGSIAIIVYVALQSPFGSNINPASIYIVSEFIAGNLSAAVTSSAVLIVVSILVMIAFRYVQQPIVKS